MRRGTIVFATLVLLWTVLGVVNNALSGFRLHLFVGGLFVTYASAALSARAGFWTVLATGAVCDSGSGLPFGTFALLFATAQTVLVQVRTRLPHDHTIGRVAIALLANLGLFLFVSFARLRWAPDAGVYWARNLVDLGASQLVIIVVAPWFFSLQQQALAHAPAA